MTMNSRRPRDRTGKSLTEADFAYIRNAHPKSIFRKKHIACLLGVSEGTIDNRLNPESRYHCPDFPQPRLLGCESSYTSAVGWIAGDFFDYNESRPIRPSRSDTIRSKK